MAQSATDTTGYVNINVGNKSSTDLTTLVGGVNTNSNYTVDGSDYTEYCNLYSSRKHGQLLHLVIW